MERGVCKSVIDEDLSVGPTGLVGEGRGGRRGTSSVELQRRVVWDTKTYRPEYQRTK